MAKKTQSPPRDFEEAMGELEQILQQIESGQISLEQSLEKFERGQFLIAHCRTVLGQAEQKIELLTKQGEGVKAEAIDAGE
jgi:exodeoxyribonuclease VII small subunit